jgi:hypothetical protein
MARRPKPKFRRGEVVFAKADGEYVRVVEIGPSRRLGSANIRCFNPRWGGDEVHLKTGVRPLTRREKGGA